MSKSILSSVPDGVGFYYGFREGDHRQINVREERCTYPPDEWGSLTVRWFGYVGGEKIVADYDASFETKAEAEAAAIAWAEAHPASDAD